MYHCRIIFTLILALFIGFGPSCTSREREENKQSAQSSTQNAPVGATAQPVETPSLPGQKAEAQAPDQTEGGQPTQPEQPASDTSEIRKRVADLCKQRFESMDVNKRGQITYEAFMKATSNRGESLFKMRDKDGNGILTLEEYCSEVVRGDTKGPRAETGAAPKAQ